ncbi:DUF6881 domain-containing protein [Streptomyces sp. MMS24-I29]|uniref:DUF6881 domain-containing protein n=1 Tax=Streptomyces sp. MMS24-I29 TaxID=3351480 RepID=UPI003C7DC474
MLPPHHVPRSRRSNQHPFQIFQEIDDRYRSEARRVETYTDGTLLWREDGYHGLGAAETEYTESEDIPGLGIINDRPNQRAESVSAAEFETLFERARGGTCVWIVDWAERTDEETDPALYCGQDQAEDAPYCWWHMRFARRMLPSLFPTA